MRPNEEEKKNQTPVGASVPTAVFVCVRPWDEVGGTLPSSPGGRDWLSGGLGPDVDEIPSGGDVRRDEAPTRHIHGFAVRHL